MKPRSAFEPKFARFALTFAVLLSFAIPTRVSAQMVGGTISGTVVDPSGAVIADVKIAVTNASTGSVANAATNSVGVFVAPNLLPGTYEVSASATGFSTLIRNRINLTVGQELVLNLTLQIGNSSQQIEVNTEAPTVDLANATVGGTVTEATVEALPLNGRSWSDLAILAPGVHLVGNQPAISSTDRTKRGMGLELSISGGRPQQNNYLLDGVNINNYTNAGPGSLLGGNLGTDAVGEFTVLTTNYSAEYGRTSGGVISAITKSGTNQFHGSAYEFLRNASLDAANFIDNSNGVSKPPFRRNQFGASAGGPIQKNKTFIFGDYEGVRQGLGSTQIATVPTPADITAAEAAIAPATADPNALLYLKTFFPASATGTFSFAGNQITGENFFITRVDHTFSEKDRIFGTYLYDNSHQTEPDEMNNKLISNQSKRQTFAAEWSHVFSPQLLNSFRVGFNRDNTASPSGATAINPAAADPQFGFDPGSSVGALTIATAYTTFSGGTIVSSPFEFRWNSFQFYDNIYYTKGIHSMKLGANAERIQENFLGADTPGGSFAFNTLADFFSNSPLSFSNDVPGTETPRHVRMSIAAGYFQDDIHFRPNLTFNVGLRYEFGEVPYEIDGKLANLRMLSATALPDPHLGSPYFRNPTKNDWEPRIGFAWDPFKNGKSSVRGGFGMFDVLPMIAQLGGGLDSSSPFAEKFNIGDQTILGGTFPNKIGTIPPALLPNTGAYYIMDFNPKRPLVLQWNLNIERQLTPSTTLGIGYVGSRGVHLWIQSDANAVQPMQTAGGNLQWPCPVPLQPATTLQGATINVCPPSAQATLTDAARPDPNISGTLSIANWSGWYTYHALQVQVKKTMSHGFQIGGNYTWAKNIDIGSGAVAADQYTNSVTGLLWYCEPCRRGLADTDVRNNITVDYLWNIPTPASFAVPLKAILGNWQAGGILTIENGRPFSVIMDGDPLGGLSVQQRPNRVSGPGCANPVNPGNAQQYIKLECFAPPNPSTQYGNAGRNTLIGPGLITLDFSLFKTIPVKKISESSDVQFRMECFNCTNRVNLSPPVFNNDIMDYLGNPINNAGLITSTTTTSRQIQLALKLSW
jgi:Carboxypeptidase regulatory-like domain/TonB dependent receptor/TonB-dependent Receptor Plug Domain